MPDSARQEYLKNAGNSEAASSIMHTGFIAQDVEKTAEQLGYDFDGVHKPENNSDNYSIVYSQFVMPLVKAAQELQQQITIIRSENETMKAQITELQKLIAKPKEN